MNAPAPLTRAEVALKLLLNVTGAATVVAVVAVFMPLTWMNWVHEAMQLGPVPGGPVFEYLARTVSALYAIHGGLCFMLARDVRRYGPVISYVAVVAIAFAGVVAIAFAGVVLWIDSKVGLPRMWVAFEAPTVFVLGAITLVLRMRSRATAG